MATVARTARRVRERKGRARVGRRERGARPVFIERGRGEERSSGREGEAVGVLQGAIDGVGINGGEWGGSNGRMKLLYAEGDERSRGRRTVGSRQLGRGRPGRGAG
jgi:hypothetical protein